MIYRVPGCENDAFQIYIRFCYNPYDTNVKTLSFETKYVKVMFIGFVKFAISDCKRNTVSISNHCLTIDGYQTLTTYIIAHLYDAKMFEFTIKE